jgi:hypothetical protein
MEIVILKVEKMKSLEILKEKKIKFTSAQKKIVERLLSGDQIIVVNQHRMSGGELMWQSPDGSINYAGSVYKAFFNIGYVVKKSYPEFNIYDFMSKERSVRI